jgi:DNA-binding response OmpR family regulator
LVVEDNEEIVEYICDCLEENYELLTAINGKAGYDLACEKTPDIVISDIMMPVMDGMEFCRKIKQNVLTSHIPVILLTAKTSVQDKADGYDAGADSYMTKPFSGNLLKSRVKNLLQNRPKLNEAATAFKNKKQLLHDSASQLDKDFIEKVTNIIETHIELEELSVSQIASMMNMSHSSLYRKIKALTDLTTNEFIRKVRMKLAEQLLLTGKYTINEIMYRVGMNSAGHFRQSFKDEFGVTPTEYLQKLRE